jgi:hypothetical protein
MQKMSPIPIALHIRSARIPVRWTVRESVEGERVFWPQVIETAGVTEIAEIEDPLDLRAQLFKMFNTNWNEDAALDFLESAGAWGAIEEDRREPWAKGTYVNVAFGHRDAVGLRVLPTTLEELRSDTGRWYRLLRTLSNPTKLKADFKQPPPADARPIDRFGFAGDAHFNNSLQVSLEWHGKDPLAVVETITAWELMIATAWADVVGRADEQVCAHCGTRFTWPRKKKHCRWECGHLVAVRNYKRKRALEKQNNKARKSLRRMGK